MSNSPPRSFIISDQEGLWAVTVLEKGHWAVTVCTLLSNPSVSRTLPPQPRSHVASFLALPHISARADIPPLSARRKNTGSVRYTTGSYDTLRSCVSPMALCAPVSSPLGRQIMFSCGTPHTRHAIRGPPRTARPERRIVERFHTLPARIHPPRRHPAPQTMPFPLSRKSRF